MKRPYTGWIPMTREEEISIWDRFYPDFSFHPSIFREHWPVFAEPTPSTSFYVGFHIFREPEHIRTQLISDLQQKMLAAFRRCISIESRIYALNWQHQCYWLDVHRIALTKRWEVPALPNGDYYLFLAQDFSFGILGQPWEMTMCVFGERLLNAFEGKWPRLFNRIARQNGDPIDPLRPITWKVHKDHSLGEIYRYEKFFPDGTQVEVCIVNDNDYFTVSSYVNGYLAKTPHAVSGNLTKDDPYVVSYYAMEECFRWDHKLG